LNEYNLEYIIKETDDFIKEHWNFTFNQIITLTDKEILSKLEKLPEIHTEKFVELINVLIKHRIKSPSQNGYNWNEIARKGIIILDDLDKKSKLFSLQKTQIKRDLQNYHLK